MSVHNKTINRFCRYLFGLFAERLRRSADIRINDATTNWMNHMLRLSHINSNYGIVVPLMSTFRYRLFAAFFIFFFFAYFHFVSFFMFPGKGQCMKKHISPLVCLNQHKKMQKKIIKKYYDMVLTGKRAKNINRNAWISNVKPYR